jgi:thiamine kinase-like enzyme
VQNIEARIAGLSCWQGKPKLTPLTGGLSTTSFLVEDSKGRFVARFGADVPAHHVFRDRECAASKAAAAAGLSPIVRHSEDSILVIDYIEGRTFTETDMRADAPRIADLLRHAHERVARHLRGPANAFWVFHIIRDYAASLAEHGKKDTQAYADLANRLEARQMPLPVIFGHHDLLPGNILDDGKRLWLIDWEYAGFGTAMFDLANVAANGSYSAEQENLLLETYFGRPASDQQRESFDAMKVASALREATWAMVSSIHLKVPGADYEAHAAEYLARTETALKHFTDRHGQP